MPHDAREDIKRMRRVADQMVTAHAVLEQRYKTYSTLMDISLMASSFVLIVLSVASAFRDATEVLGAHVSLTTVTIIGSALVFVISVAEWRVQWKGKAARHGDARKEFSTIKSELGALLGQSDPLDQTEERRLLKEYQAVGARSPAIPDNKFLALKQIHLRKVYVSRLLDKHPFAPILLIRLRAHFAHSKRVFSDADK